MNTHTWEPQGQFCSCGQDTVTCQGCGKLVCGNVSLRVSDPKDSQMSRNIGPCCFAKFGLGHSGTTARDKWEAELRGETTMGLHGCPQ